ncbi:SusC/RagA family TonB-linked outer membrane protein [Chondrinema litorale]|uniref:SusC/RagA family TonB-linked outer membrane protein n=1 Tax=Chondrinema litorale TaxID=2994555 RepID=UPI0025436277|nr:SusC/RagA family TonB-linked outer membrane protein [Chondrinema litorale]UZR98826.1 SusC/RagA family TonB-linked outer membrane protein [Chondrinema litorale]
MELKILRQILLMSKHAIFGLIIQCMLYSIMLANNGVAQKASIEEIYVSLELKDVPVEDAFKVLEQRTDFKFNYDKIVLKEQQRITAFAKKESLANVLRDISKNTGLQFTRIDENIHVSKKRNSTPSVTEVINEEDVVQTSISGTVTSADDGLPLPGVSILIKGSSTGAVTDFEGNYRITVNQGSTLQFSYIGFKSTEIEVSNQSVINISLEPDLEQLEEVVVIGYGTQKKADITGAIATLEPENVTERPLNKVDQVLVGQLAGVRVKQTSGLPGKGFSIQVRGTGSINANNEPLYVVDGFPLEASSQSSSGGFSNGNPLNNLNPNDIESIQVLKDAASASIYGSRGSNGVVLITTKKGKAGKPQISFNTYSGWSETVKKLDVLSAEEWVDRQVEHINYAWVKDHASDLGATSSQTNEERRALLGLPEGSVNTNYMFDDRWFDENHEGLDYLDYQDLFFRKGFMQNYQLSATGGNEIARYYVSGDMFDQEGVALGVDYTRYSARANVELTPNKKLRFGLNLSPSYSIANDPGVEGKDAITHIVVGTSPVVESYAGPYGNNVGENAPYAWGTSRPSPLAEAREKIGTGKTFRTISTIFGEYEIISGLKFKTSVNYDVHNYNHKSWTPSYVNRNRTASAGYSGYTRQNFVQENTLNYSKTFGNHNLSILGGYSYSLYKFEDFSLSGTGFASDEVTTINAATSVSGSSSESKNVLISYFGRAQYSFMDKYLFSASIRRDGSSKFGDNTKWGIFPSASVGWRISEEAFMQGIEPVSDFKIRASWGIAGNNGIGDYGHIATLSNANYSFDGTLVNGQIPSNFPNPDLSWEQSETVDIGFDLGLLDNRIFTSFDYYTKKNTDLLLEIPVPTASGFSSALTNIGEVLNKGWEVEVSTRNLVGDFKWNTKVNFSHNTNEVKKLGPNNTPILGGAFDINHNILEVGRPMYTLYLVQDIGILTSEDIANGYPLYGNEEAGDPKYLDVNDDGVIDADDRTYSGHPNPDYVWGITNNFSYKGFDLSILLQGQWGGVIYSTFGRAMNRTGQGKADNHLGYIRDRVRWEEDGVITAEDVEGKVRKSPSSFGRIKNTDWRYPNDYWRVRNITLGYDLGSLFQSNVVSGARVYVTAENWFGKDKYYGGFNPEAVNNSGDDYGAFPLSKSMIFGVNLKF